MRQKLIELLKQARRNAWGKSLSAIGSEEEFAADHLLANGVIVLPCKVGDTVYVINDWEVEKTSVDSMDIRFKKDRRDILLLANVADHDIKFKDEYGNKWKYFVFGKTVFLTREEAEAALKEGQG